MIPLATKQGEKVDLYTPLLKSVEDSSGPQISSALEPVFKKLQQYRDEFLQISGYRSNTSDLEKLTIKAKAYLTMWDAISQSFTFGKEKGSVDIKFTWYDSYTHEKKTTTNPKTERLATLYNLAVVYSQMGMNQTATVDDHFKQASDNFLIAAFLFEKIKAEAATLTSPDFGLDLTIQNLQMCSHIMKAQAQYCAHEKVFRKVPDRYDLLAPIAMQAATYYGGAYSFASTPPVCKAADVKNFVSVLQFSETQYMAQAYYWAACNQEKVCKDNSSGMGLAVAYIRKATDHLAALQKLEKQMSPSVLTKYKELCKLCSGKREHLEDLNTKIYQESVPTKIPEIEMKPVGQPINIEADLSKTFEGQDVLQRMVPPPVRELEEEFKREVGAVMGHAFDVNKNIDNAVNEFLGKHNLPAALHAVSGEQDLPEDLWAKIRQCKEKGGMSGLQQIMSGVETLAENNNSTLEKLYGMLKQEEDEDQAMRTKYGSAWTRTPSPALNCDVKKQLDYYKQRFDQGRAADAKVKAEMESKKDQLSLIELDRATLTTKIPKKTGPAEVLSPAAAKYF